MSMADTPIPSTHDAWTGSTVRDHRGRKGRVVDHEPASLFDRSTRLLLVHWEDDTHEVTESTSVQMIRPPLGYTPAPERVGRVAQATERHPRLIVAIILLGMVASLAAVAVWRSL